MSGDPRFKKEAQSHIKVLLAATAVSGFWCSLHHFVAELDAKKCLHFNPELRRWRCCSAALASFSQPQRIQAKGEKQSSSTLLKFTSKSSKRSSCSCSVNHYPHPNLTKESMNANWIKLLVIIFIKMYEGVSNLPEFLWICHLPLATQIKTSASGTLSLSLSCTLKGSGFYWSNWNQAGFPIHKQQCIFHT